ncbi:Sec2p-domain-containing protein [Corynespora cassiicola Philippines]|uniref:Sec2p-domain-containing protein n=1 Tax=Corynespora cassiicola Philippines TaxID=1448308 RepID=A0A2T2NY34_CORCC|nr:Sec2p-domain-containing protein [Corynespora cassiicola Philippines]
MAEYSSPSSATRPANAKATARFVHTAPWVHFVGANGGTMTPSRLRALSSTHSPNNKEITKSASTPQLRKAASPASPSSSPQPDKPRLLRSETDSMNTIPDPRSHSPSPSLQPQRSLSRNNSTDSTPSDLHPDLSQEVATLSTKLVNAINHNTNLDDSLQQTRHELDSARKRLADLVSKVQRHEDLVASGMLVEKEVYLKMEKQLNSELQEERKRRTEAEKAKRNTDAELENLTASLFEEANAMVVAARKATEASEKRNEQLKQQLSDAEVLQTSLQEQLQDLKGVVEKMSSHGDDNESTLPTTTAPSTPGITPADKMSKLFEAANLTPNTPGSEEIAPDHPLHFSHLIHPVLRSDLTAFREFQEMLKISARSAPSSRVSSGNYGSLNVLGLGSLTNSSTTSLPSTAKSPGSNSSSPRESLGGAGMPNLKDEKFYKRAVTEDIEPTLRLDIAPGLSWMARRTVLTSITAGSLVVEPNPPPPKFRGPIFPCSLCGESRKGDQYARKFRFKTAETEETQKYPLCDYCLGRIRSTCDYISFLRMVAAGHWRAETEEERKSAWEESVRLRERMFWARIGGGVVPSFVPMRESPRSPTFSTSTGKVTTSRKSEESQMSDKPLDSAVDMTEPPKKRNEDDPFQTKDEDKSKRISIGRTIISVDAPPEDLTQDEEKKIENQAESQLELEVLKSMERMNAQHQGMGSSPSSPALDAAPQKKEGRLSLTIPGSFD